MSIGGIAASAVISGGGSAYSAAVLADIPSGYWRLGDSSGTTAVDSSGNARNGVYSGGFTLGAAGLVTGDADTAAVFNGTTGHVVVTNSFGTGGWLNPPGAHTIEALINPSAVATGVIASHYGSSASWLMRLESGKLSCYIYNSGYIVVRSTTTMVAGTKYHCAFTYDGTNGKVYVNGVLEATLAMAGRWDSADNFTIGSNSVNAEWFNGKIDEVAFYPTALSAARIAVHAAAA